MPADDGAGARATFERDDSRARVVGEVDMSNADDLRVMLEGHPGDLVIDCSELTFVDSSGISVLAYEARRRELAGHRLRVTAVQPNVRRVFEICGMLEYLE